MSYHIYTTKALVCGSFNQGQSDRTLVLFTESLGMVFATARSVREERSRQRYALQPFSLNTISLIRGKAGWRIGSVVPITNYYQVAQTREARIAVTDLIKVVRQYIQGEQADQTLFAELIRGCEALITREVASPSEHVLLVTTRLLERLGYVAIPPHLAPVVAMTEETHLPNEAAAELTALIKQASTASHL